MGEKSVAIPEVSCDKDWMYLTGQLDKQEVSREDESGTSRFRAPPLRRLEANQILLVDVFQRWSGPCLAVESHLRRMRHRFADSDVLVLARACCDDIEQLEAFKSDIRPTFLFWTRGRPVALLRGANKPLLTKLIHQEVESRLSSGDPKHGEEDIDLHSPKVIQCSGELASFEDDDAIRSIGQGRTERLSDIFQPSPAKNDLQPVGEEADICKKENPVPTSADEFQSSSSAPEQSGSQVLRDEDAIVLEENEAEVATVINKQEEKVEVIVDENDGAEVHEDEQGDKEEGKKMDASSDLVAPFGTRKRKKRKKMETGLLKEILDYRPSGGRRHAY